MAVAYIKVTPALRLYRGVLLFATPFILLRLWWRGRREPDYRRRIGERFGFVQLGDGRSTIWFHAVSAGEVIAAAPLIRSIADHYPQHQVLVSTMTPTGAEQVEALLGDVVLHRYAPYDINFAVARYWRNVRPKLLVLMETELWPNLIHQAATEAVPTCLINGRLSERSARGYRRLAILSKPMLAQLTHISCQYLAHAERFRGLGVDQQCLSVAGNLKFDRAIPEDLAVRRDELMARCQLQGQLVWLAASTHSGEENLILQCFEQLRRRFPQLRLILAPRHPPRAEELLALVQSAGFPSRRLSSLSELPLDGAAEVLIVDQMGVLLPLYDLADVAFVGGSLIPFGGQNPIEPALMRTPVVSGPHCFNFTEIVEKLVAAGGMYQIDSVASLAETTAKLLEDAELRERAGAAGYAEAMANKGASQRVADRLIQLIGNTA
jgi:3-deoxy-D-manno-octulosonic-acid transferase